MIMALHQIELFGGNNMAAVFTAGELLKLQDQHKGEVAVYMRDICTQNMMDEDDAAKAASWRKKAEAWEKVRDAYAIRAHGKSELDVFTA